MIDGTFDWEWGDWVLGDLSDVLRRACEAVGRTAVVERVTIQPPSSPDAYPQVTLTVLGESDFLGLRKVLLQGEHSMRFFGEPPGQYWEADVVGLRLVVALEGGGLR